MPHEAGEPAPRSHTLSIARLTWGAQSHPERRARYLEARGEMARFARVTWGRGVNAEGARVTWGRRSEPIREGRVALRR